MTLLRVQFKPFRPKLLVLDEAFSGLDPLVRDEFMEGLLQQAGELTILISSHELSEIDGVATYVAFLDEDRLLFQESMSDLVARFREVHVTLDQNGKHNGERTSVPLPAPVSSFVFSAALRIVNPRRFYWDPVTILRLWKRSEKV